MSSYFDFFTSFITTNPLSYILSFIVFLIFFKKYINGGVCYFTQDLSSQIIVITGASAGIGKYTNQE